MINQQTPQYSDYEIAVIYAVYAIVRDKTGGGELFFERKGIYFEVLFELYSANSGFVFDYNFTMPIEPQHEIFRDEFCKFLEIMRRKGLL